MISLRVIPLKVITTHYRDTLAKLRPLSNVVLIYDTILVTISWWISYDLWDRYHMVEICNNEIYLVQRCHVNYMSYVSW